VRLHDYLDYWGRQRPVGAMPYRDAPVLHCRAWETPFAAQCAWWPVTCPNSRKENTMTTTIQPRWTTTMLIISVALAAGALVVPTVPAQAQTTCNFLPVTISGTAGNDTITGTAAADVIAAAGGNDTVFGLGGNDTVCLGTGNDNLIGGTGDDTAVAEDGADGADSFFGQAGMDSARYLSRTVALNVSLDGVANDGAPGEGDNNRLDVENVLGGQAGNVLIGNASNNTLNGSRGEDILIGIFGDDLLRGGNGNDDLRGGLGDDFILGGTGNDTATAAAAVDGADFFEGGSGLDTGSYSARIDPLNVSLDGIANDGAPGEGDNIRLDVENVIGGTDNDVIVARLFQENPNRLSGGGGNDTLNSVDPFISNDTLDGGLFGFDVCTSDPDDVEVNCEA